MFEKKIGYCEQKKTSDKEIQKEVQRKGKTNQVVKHSHSQDPPHRKVFPYQQKDQANLSLIRLNPPYT